MKAKPVTLTYSARNALHFCPYSYYLKHVQCMRKKRTQEDVPLTLGGYVHDMVEVKQSIPAPEGLEAYDAAKARAIAVTIIDAGLVDGLDYQEKTFNRRLPGLRQAWLQGKLDGYGSDRVWELKTSADKPKDCAQVVAHSGQLETYAYGVGNTTCDADIVCATKPTIKPKHASNETPEQYELRCTDWMAQEGKVGRFEHHSTASDVDAMVDKYVQDVRYIRWCHKNGFAKCTGYGCKTPFFRWCDYKPFCWYDDMDPFEFVEHEHSELVEAP